ncbi:MAG: DNA-processing protein DprA [Myxococcales bacterium]|nr:DNA-processing protein DprA [Myxococcales bacterium]
MDTISGFWAGAQDLAERLDLQSLAERAGGWKALSEAGVSDLMDLGLPHAAARKWLSTPPRSTAWQAVTLVHPCYPPLLAARHPAPPVLFVDGQVEVLTRRAIAVVGTRRCNPYGAAVARHLGTALGSARIVTVSGLARGIDTHAHRGALSSDTTVAVLGHGLQHTAPPSNKRLRQSILDGGGALITAFPDEHPPARWTFPSRNRWIAGMAEAVIVVQAPSSSGALITAGNAADMGIDVYAVPGPIGIAASRGSNELLAAGAEPLLDVDTFVAERVSAHAPSERPEWLRIVLAGGTLEQAARQRGSTPLDVLEELTRMELQGLVVRLPGGRYGAAGGA